MEAVYMRRRITAVIVLLAALIGLGALIDAAMSPNFSCDVDSVTAEWGDSLWSIAERQCSGDIQSAVEAMIGLNRTTWIQAGQTVHLP